MSTSEKCAEYIRQVCQQVANKEVHDTIALELENHLAEKIEDYQAFGYSEEESVEKAIAEMGDPVTVGGYLHQAHKPRMEWSILAIVTVLIGIGLLTMYSLSLAQDRGEMFTKQLAGILGGVAVFLGILFTDYRRLKRYSKLLFFSTMLLLLCTSYRGTLVNGVYHLDLGFTLLNISVHSPFLLVVAMAGMFTDWDWNKRRTIVWTFLLFLPPFFLLGTLNLFAALVYAVGFFVLLFSTPARKRMLLSLASLFFVSGCCIAYQAIRPYHLNRLLAYLDPYSDPNGAGYTIIQSMKTVASAGLWGNGFGSRLDTVPVIESDFIFTFLVHNFGLATGSVVVLLGILLFHRLLRAKQRVKDPYGALLMSGLMALLFLPYFWGIFMTVGLVPLTSVNLPFISYGITPFVQQMVLVGLLLGIYRRKDLQPRNHK
ncbi:FtsW/RodA/SpoVE family cell cycle protein [Brevibacillus sp. GCM10020057]|uniref:FtsW/RodA/SpoVE family cell cycle protein n=1 Tax=Brevibacillus sp. GCM10020057 TaxID=3317327 RepID=UPI00363A1470